MRSKTIRPRRRARQLTLRGFSRKLEEVLRQTAEAENLSLNRVALRFLERGARLSTVGAGLDEFIGGWTKRQADAVLGRTRDFERIDSEF